MSMKSEKNSQKPWFLSNAWAQMVSRPKQIQKEMGLRAEEAEHSQIYGLILPIAAAGASLIVLFVIVMTMCFFKKKKAVVGDVSGPSIVVYPSNQGSYPQFLLLLGDRATAPFEVFSRRWFLLPSRTKDILFSLPPLRHSNSLGDLLEQENDSDAGLESLVPVGKTHSQRSNSFSCYGLGVIDPALYRSCSTDLEDDHGFPENHIGRLWFSLRYESSTEKLLVSILKAKNLPSRSVGTVNGCDPLVRLHLLPDERRYQQSKTKKKTCNPFFDETFVFQVPAKDLFDHLLKVTVIDSGRAKRRAIIGHVSLPLKGFSEETEQKLFKMDLEKEVQENFSSNSGELLISLLYNETLNRLSVTVVEARKLKFKDPEKIDSYVKVTLNQNYRAIKAKKTAIVRGAEEPSFFECFNFRVNPDAADVSSLCFEAFQSVSGYGRDKLIGKFILGSPMFARGKGMTHWASAFSSPKEAFQQWHILSA